MKDSGEQREKGITGIVFAKAQRQSEPNLVGGAASSGINGE